MPDREKKFEEAKQAVSILKSESILVFPTKEENVISEIEENFKTISSEILERSGIVKEDIGRWEIYVDKLSGMVNWVEEKKSIMKLGKAKEKKEIDRQKALLEVYYVLFSFFILVVFC